MSLWAKKLVRGLTFFVISVMVLRLTWDGRGFVATIGYIFSVVSLIVAVLYLTLLMGVSEAQLRDFEQRRKG